MNLFFRPRSRDKGVTISTGSGNPGLISLLLLSMLGSSCTRPPVHRGDINREDIRFSGERALETVRHFVTAFPNRDSGQPNNERAAQWIRGEFDRMGLITHVDSWEVINYSKRVPLRNVVGVIPGKSSREITTVAHFDQSPDTYEGADNDGSGIAVLLQLAEIFSSEPTPAYTLVFLASDGEEYGMLGSLRYVQTHENREAIIAALSLDNVGKELYDGLRMDPRGQFRGYGALWFQLLAREAAQSIGEAWIPMINPPVLQILDQAVPISFMDEGPFVAYGIPSFGLAGNVPPDKAQLHWETYHSPSDLVAYQSAGTLGHTGRVSEAILRQCLRRETFPEESGPYVYVEDSGTVLRGLPLYLVFVGFLSVLLAGAVVPARKHRFRSLADWVKPAVHFLTIWAPLLSSIVLTYGFVAVGLMDRYHLYPATSKDEPLFEPRWTAVILWVTGLALLVWIGRVVAKRVLSRSSPVPYDHVKSVAILVVALGATYVFAINPFSLCFFVPLLSWFFIRGRKGMGRFLDIVLFLFGGLLVYILIYFFGFMILRNGFAILWYLMMMFSIGMISFPTAAAITAVISAGLSTLLAPSR
ncbi:MAG: M28 family metallopeptidase [Fidelibacterota bacterium]